MTVVQTRVGPVAYRDTGRGPAVVLLHATLHDSRDFDPVLPGLSREHRVIAVDWPGHGDSPMPGEQPTATSLADVLRDVVQGLDLPAATFIGNSVGGFAAARLAITDPQRVSRLVLVDTGGFTAGPVTNLFCRTMGIPSVLQRVLPRFIGSYLKPASAGDRAIRDRAVARARTAEGVHLAAALWRSFADPGNDLSARAERITAPTLIVWGARDTAIPLRFGRAAAAAIPGSRLEIMRTGHVPFSSDPDGFLAVVLPFLADLDTKTAGHRG